MRRIVSTIFLTSAVWAPAAYADDPTARLNAVNHIVVIYLENHSFDNLYGLFPGANGLEQAAKSPPQMDQYGKPYPVLPAVKDARISDELPNRPFPIERYIPAYEKSVDLVHRFYQNQAQINGGRNDRFAAVSDAAGLVMGYYDGSKLPLWQYARKYTLTDNFYQGAFGGSFLNHFWLICACTPQFKDAPEEMRAKLDIKGQLIKDGAVTPDGYAVNTLQPAGIPYRAGTPDSDRLPLQDAPTIGDRLSAKEITWAWYSGGWNEAINGHPDKAFQHHHQPFGYFRNYAAGSFGRSAHLKDEADFIADIDSASLPAVSFYKPSGTLNEHPGYADVLSGDQHAAEMIGRIERSPLWKDSVIIVTYDENGGFWDHAAPPVKDRWGPGSRVPTMVISPFAKRNYVDHTEYDTTSILKFIETRFGLSPLGVRDAAANSLSNALDLR